MYDINYLISLYIIEIIGILLIIALLFILGTFKHKNKESQEITLESLINKVKSNNKSKYILDSVMNDFYAKYYKINNLKDDFEKWIDFIKTITMIDYMNVEQVAKFRDELVSRNFSYKQEIEYAIGISLKYREEQNKSK